ncbi:MAG: hypothetical protein OYH76_01115 [Defluviicoccus sp.]|nr:hypothetical protein [Defluviicoccus sp.]MDE0274463.1 hypothetical protein [Defluviicoccus sp.]
MEPQPRERLHRLVDEVPDQDIDVVEHLLECLCAGEYPTLHTPETAPIDDEPLTEEDLEAIEEARRDIEAGNGIPHEEIMRRYRL